MNTAFSCCKTLLILCFFLPEGFALTLERCDLKKMACREAGPLRVACSSMLAKQPCRRPARIAH
jgi:hypothetical protein